MKFTLDTALFCLTKQGKSFILIKYIVAGLETFSSWLRMQFIRSEGSIPIRIFTDHPIEEKEKIQ